MPRKSKGPRLYLHKGQWIIRDGKSFRRTGCRESEADEARRRLRDYLAENEAGQARTLGTSNPLLREIVMAYAEVQLPKRPNGHRKRELAAQCARLIEFMKDARLSAVNGPWCRAYAGQSSTQSMARHDLEIARAAVNHWAKEYGVVAVPQFTLPDKGNPRTGHLTRSMAARLLRCAHRAGNAHLARYVIIGVYTGTRSNAILSMRWLPSTDGGWFDLDKGVMYRAPEGERETKKRKPPAVIPNRLLAHLKRWKRQDEASGAIIPHVIHWNGKPVNSVKKAFRRAVVDAGLPEWVIPHILRHTAITWAVERGVKMATVCSFFGISTREAERTYWHRSHEYQQEMRKSR